MKLKILLALEPVLIALGLLLPTTAFSHSNFLANNTVKPRDNGSPQANKTPAGVVTSFNKGQMKADPGVSCGALSTGGTAVPRSSLQPVTNLKAGASLVLNWAQTIPHGGWWQIWFTTQSDDTGWQVLQDNIQPHASGAGGNFTTTITIPNVTCSTCTFRLNEVMTDNGAAVPNASVSYYYSCANITITPDGSAPGGSTGSSGSTSGSSGSGDPNCPP